MTDQQIFLQLLEVTELFPPKGKAVIRMAHESKVLPAPDFEQLLFLLKLEANLMYVVDSRADSLLDQIKHKYAID
ncbi:MAG: hypothetical protein COW24_00280 [Candidatus Kerfeldbacteria bacterium CG15_BIG_FIL_POST_REV_8_21_14_020_45_12]|uniref:Type II secretion system protein GspE N-terminal domain-containing protein n=1 Tax=Candidatus Kerfeldbacteria bacterium CG15_BIG_FIL_POST_REV_8_21_14_020_45_12 TaxID=2014247 RepID=A0A2M7H556_9BACT|nr:MAG: hypothetical protein COW24_00280 [Candidatus Kerfeldbacteria bacterium CG15_BIG_FIL_POST_REV_8_21_14_020_45_12]PJA92819.1 MAG: hypothetical protein CO132_06120 [Candidatus Kerfeldbacteria bacterium CG_4_9_14_3_um_filter_45_8]